MKSWLHSLQLSRDSRPLNVRAAELLARKAEEILSTKLTLVALEAQATLLRDHLNEEGWPDPSTRR